MSAPESNVVHEANPRMVAYGNPASAAATSSELRYRNRRVSLGGDGDGPPAFATVTATPSDAAGGIGGRRGRMRAVSAGGAGA
jgi:hypothetical protein